MPNVIVFFARQIFLLNWIAAQFLAPRSPCPGIFDYEAVEWQDDWLGSSSITRWKGIISVTAPLPVHVKLQLVLLTPLTKKYNAKFSLAESKESLQRKIRSGILYNGKYNINFPYNLPVPQVTLVQINSKVVCSSVPMPARAQTTLTFEHSLRSQPLFHPGRGTSDVTNRPIKYGSDPWKKDKEPRLENNTYLPDVIDFDVRDIASILIHNPGQVTVTYPPIASDHLVPAETVEPFGFAPIRKEDQYYVPTSTEKNNNDRTNFPQVNRNDPLLGVTCGKIMKKNPLILNGAPASRGDWPWAVPLYKKMELGLEFICSSSLVTTEYLVTAAHCLQSLDKTEVIAYVGRFNITSWTEEHVQPRDISNVFIHPDYNPQVSYSDVAILKLQTAVRITPYSNPVCLWDSGENLNDIVGSIGMVFGWGRDEFGHKITATPRRAPMPVVSQEECLRSKEDFLVFTSNKTFCAGFRNGTSPCNGDSGGGLMLSKKAQDGSVRWFLRGVVSSSLYNEGGGPSCDTRHYIIFTDVAKFKTWFYRIIKF